MATTSPAREYVSARLTGYERVLIPRAGHFDTVAAVIKRGLDPAKVYASDVSLDASVVGYLADPRRSVRDLGVRLEGEAACFVEGDLDDVAYGAGVQLALAYMAIPPSTQFKVSQRRNLIFSRDALRAGLTDKLTKLLAIISGIHYEVDSPASVCSVEAEGAALYVDLFNLPSKPKSLAEPPWDRPPVQDVTKPEVPELLESLHGAPQLVFVRVNEETEVPGGWDRVFAHAKPKFGVIETAYVFSNRPTDNKHAEAPADDKSPHIYEIFDEYEITPQSVISFVQTDKSTCLYYRDLFVHRLPTVQSGVYFLMLIDGKVVTAIGLHEADLMRGRSQYLSETFGISVTSRRYERLGKFYMRLLTSGDFRSFILATKRAFIFNEPRGIQTTSLTHSPEGKTDRSVMRLVFREPILPAGYRVIYQGDFRDDTYSEVITEWLKEFGHRHRAPYVCSECGFGTDSYAKRDQVQTVAKKKKGRGSGGAPRREEPVNVGG